jgi:Ca2+-binding RTX toxin-like protein
MAIITGTNLNNTIFGTGTADTIDALGGDDFVSAKGGNDTVLGGLGNDILLGDAGNDTLTGNAGDDNIQGGSGNDTINGDDASATGNDILDGGEGEDGILGGLGDDFLFGGSGNDNLDGGENNDILDGGEGEDIINGGNGDDIIYSTAGYDIVQGGTGADTYFVFIDEADLGGSVQTHIADAGGVDTLNFSLLTQGVIANLADGAFVQIGSSGQVLVGSNGVGSAAANIENAIGTGFDDRIIGNALANRIEGGTGNDRLFGREGGDTLIADAGDDIVSGGFHTESRTTSTSTLPGLPFQSFKIIAEVGEDINLPTYSSLAAQGTSVRVGVEFDVFAPNFSTGSTTAYELTVTVFDPGTSTQVPLNFIFEGQSMGEASSSFSGSIVADPLSTFTSGFIGNLIIVGLDPNSTQDLTIRLSATTTVSGNQLVTRTESLFVRKVDLDATVSGDDTLDGGAFGAGLSTLIGGDGNDTYVLRDTIDLVQENADEGTDLVQSALDYVLPFAVENLLLLEGGEANSGEGNSLHNVITGNNNDNGLYGRGGDDTLNGGLGHDTLDGGAGNDAMTGGFGNDSYFVDQAGDTVVEQFGGEGGIDHVTAQLTAYTLAANVENGALDAVFGISLSGNVLDNVLTGNGGDNALNGGGGNDTMRGGFGNDIFYVQQSGDLVEENLLDGVDTVISTLPNYVLTANVENLTLLTGALTGTGNELDNLIIGNSAANTLTGGLGNDTLNGSTGADTMNGGAGNDIYVVDNLADVIVELSGIDTIQTGIQLASPLIASIENLTLTGALAINGFGNMLANRIVGNSAVNTLEGFDNNDILEGGSSNDILRGGNGNDRLDGGIGDDTMEGGAGNDTYVVNSTTDIVTELAGGGTADRIESFVTIAALAAEVENLTLMGTISIGGTGNALVNRITGNSGNNVIDGAGGADIMNGGAGNDVYKIDVVGEIVTELAGEGTADRVESFVTYALTANVENLTLLGLSDINGTGNTLANVITGNGADNVLNGGAGGLDDLRGLGGNDTYVVDDVTDTVTEVNAFGVDLVQSSVSFTLGNFIENLTLTGANAINGTGNALANIITGNTGNNTLDGGLGADTMAGGSGNDVYIVDNLLDTVTDNNGTADEVRASVTRTLEATIEKLTLTGAAAIDGTGNTLANTIVGNDQANTIDGKAGADTLTGGLGVDRFQFTVLQNLADTITDWTNDFDVIVISAAAFGGGLVAGGAVQFKFDDGIPAPTGTGGQFLFDDTTSNLYFDQNGTGAGGLFHIAFVQGGGGVLDSDNFVVIA